MKRQKPDKSSPKGKWFSWFVVGCFIGYLLAMLAAYAVVSHLGKDLPNLDNIANLRFGQLTHIYSADGVTLGTVISVYRKWVPLEKIPKPLQWATIVAEDRKFYTHPGIDPKGIVRAIWECLKARRYVQGGSTITMQLARNLYLSSEKTIRRKLKELLLAVQLERRFSKDELLELYLNTVCYGHGAYGVQAAAELYFGKDVSQLTLPQASLLASLPKRPSDLSPFVNPEAAKRRRDYILEAMAEEGYITRKEAEEAKKIPITQGLRPEPKWLTKPPKALHFVEFVKRELVRRFGQDIVDRGGLKVYTTINYDLQKEVERIAERYLRAYRFTGADQMAFVVIHIPTGKILAMYGGRPYRIDPNTGKRRLDHFNRAVQAYRQPGSSFKPYVYAAALEIGFRPNSIFSDSPISFPQGNGKWWSPKNYDGRYGRKMTLKTALATSNNVIAVKLIRAVGVDKTVEVANRLGVKFPSHANPNVASYSLALGSIGITVLDHTAALASVANGGMKVNPTGINRVYDNEGNLIYVSKPEQQQVLMPEIASQLLTMLIATVTEGTGRRAQIRGYQVGGKTGTSENIKDVWFVGFTPTIACGVWLGRDDNKPLRTGSGGTLCAPIFREIVTATIKRYPSERTFSLLDNKRSHDGSEQVEKKFVRAVICSGSGLLATKFCPLTQVEYLPSNKVPRQRCSIHREKLLPVLICTASGKLATPNCPVQAVVTKALQRSQIPKEACDLHSPSVSDLPPEERTNEETEETRDEQPY
ncbi:MAG: PBP1A family penicillin-binding protein [Armatimonadetes bacterium]|nr:PBP1A family penicillin-binding protein [Armatimonadota bacterium]